MLQIEVLRDGEKRHFEVAPAGHRGQRRIGVEIWSAEEYRPAPLPTALGEGVRFPVLYGAFIAHGFAESFIGKTKAVFAGPIGVVRVAQRQIDQGTRAALGIIAIYAVYLGFFLLWPMPICDGGRFIGYLARRRAPVEARDLGEVTSERMRIPSAVVITLILFALLALWGVLQQQWEAVATAILIAAGVALRHPAGWNFARTLLLLSLVGAPLFVWLSRRPARAWFGLVCPACHGDARPVLGDKSSFGCLCCGSAWRRAPSP
jgi:hypothetical protein